MEMHKEVQKRVNRRVDLLKNHNHRLMHMLFVGRTDDPFYQNNSDDIHINLFGTKGVMRKLFPREYQNAMEYKKKYDRLIVQRVEARASSMEWPDARWTIYLQSKLPYIGDMTLLRISPNFSRRSEDKITIDSVLLFVE